ncbi:uncharacterized protein MONBRDRAFT_34173 [Monosiga brevicollis MX1]|uniref:Palmitoyl-protein thioesterase 1 n=1 Tax=Monosiga brevicollis TaxID=81824 RepID=A9VA05_MONBE|nr:uncharacterized protein MONBRDRAFT_34173 [Monosiga brevicollis MX1]EDQ85646.1 predicted protein [Monosiga brevicollis MX1]|eukprot:XP_001749595.1 hypothetical protein [Monosiga brevicollis MX1]
MRACSVTMILAAAACCCGFLAPSVRAEDSAYPPVVIMHGILGTAENLETVAEWIREQLPGIYVKSMEVGNGALDSVFMDMNKQVELFCENIYADEKLKDGFNLIGFSQGGLVSRGYLQRCNKYPVINFISWASPQGGQFGGVEALVPPVVSVIFGRAPYSPLMQSGLALAQYWRDPYALDLYRSNSSFLADLNNERPEKNETYKKHITSLKSMMLLHSTVDEVISPPTSGWFETFLPFTGPGEKGVVVPLRQSLLYLQDWIGLKVLDKSGRLQMHTSDCAHEDHPNAACKHSFDLYTLPLISETWDSVRSWRVKNPMYALNAH